MSGLMLIPWDGPERWRILAQYNGEVSRGIVHTDEWRERMAELQREFHAEREAKLMADGYRRSGDGWIRTEMRPGWRWWRHHFSARR